MTNIKKNDTVLVIAGKNRGKRGKVLRVFGDEGRVAVEGVAIAKLHEKSRKSGKKGQVVERPMPVSMSNVLPVCPKCDKGVRVRAKFVGDKKMRACAKCGAEMA